MPVKGWIEVNDLYCKGCELCVQACPQDVLSLDMERLTPKGYQPGAPACRGLYGMRHLCSGMPGCGLDRLP